MLFGEQKIDTPLKEHNTAQIVFLSKEGATIYANKFIENGFVDCTPLFLEGEGVLDYQELAEKLNKQDNIFDINLFYHYWVSSKRQDYMAITWPFYFLMQKLLPLLKTKFIIIAFKRPIKEYESYSGNAYDTVLFSDFVDLFIYPTYHEFKLFSQDMDTFNRFISYIQETNEVPDKYNFSIIQYMKKPSDNIDRVDYQ